MSAKKHRKSRVPVAVQPPRTSIWAFLAITATALVAAWLGYGWVLKWPLVVVPVVVGGAIALCMRTRAESAVSGGIAGLLAAVLAYALYSVELMSKLYLSGEQVSHWMNFDVPPLTYRIAATALLDNPASWAVTKAGSSDAALAAYLVSGVGVGVVAFGVSYLLKKYRAALEPRRQAIAWILVAIVSASAFASIITAASLPALEADNGAQISYIAHASTAPKDGDYAFDGAIYERAYYEMLKGKTYYEALPIAAAGDKRLAGTGTVKNGKFYSWAHSPAFVREPAAFYLWRIAAPGGAAGVIYLGAMLCALVLAVVYWGLSAHIGQRAIFVALILLPYLLWISLGPNIFFPDYWAALAVTASVAVLLRGRWIEAGALAALAAVFRETLMPWPLILAALALYFWLRSGREREWLVRFGALAGFSVLFLVQYWVHLQLAGQIIAKVNQSAQGYLFARAGSTFTWKVLQPTYYLMWAYGFLRFPGTVLFALGPIGMWFAAEGRRERWAAASYGAFWILWFVVMGASSSYWGQVVMPAAIVGSGVLLASADSLADQVRAGWAEFASRRDSRRRQSEAQVARS